jgi:phospholipid-binding lipoprotein MlaA
LLLRAPHVRRQVLGILTAVVFAGVTAPASARADAPPAVDPLYDDAESAPPPAGFPDPFEPLNRATFRLNGHISRWVLKPLVRAYGFAVPAGGRRAIRRALVNFNSPSVFVNDVLQLKPVDAGVIAARFVVNTTIGIVGLFDPAARMGMTRHDSDFGQTLALMSVPSGPYLILPVMGPTTARDGTGYLVDLLFRPTTYLLPFGVQMMVTPVTAGGAGIAELDASADALQALEASSLDYYAALKNAFYQNRLAHIWARSDGPHPIVLAARWTLQVLPLTAPGSEVINLPADAGKQTLEALALED